MTKDTLYTSGEIHEDFTFNHRVAEVFDDMLSRSIPYYRTVIDGIVPLIKQRLRQGLTVYDLGCSTGTALLEISRQLNDDSIQFIGVDNAPAMIDKAKRKKEMFADTDRIEFRQGDIVHCDLANAGVIICNYTLQFLRPMARQSFVKQLFEALPNDGLLILSEKNISHSHRLNRDFINIYHGFKRKQGYSELEIAAKREALENILVPFSLDENTNMLHEAGFKEVETFFKWFNFTSLVALKRT